MLILVEFLGFGAKKQGGWSNSQGKNPKVDPLCILELLGRYFNLAKFHPKRRDWMYPPLPDPLVNSVLNPAAAV